MLFANKYYITFLGSSIMMYNIKRLFEYHLCIKPYKNIVSVSQFIMLLSFYLLNFNKSNNYIFHMCSKGQLYKYVPLLIYVRML